MASMSARVRDPELKVVGSRTVKERRPTTLAGPAPSPLSLQRLVGNAAAVRVLQWSRAKTRSATKFYTQRPFRGRRSVTREWRQQRMATYRATTVPAAPAEKQRIIADQNLGPATVGTVRYPAINEWRRGIMEAHVTQAMLKSGSRPGVDISGIVPGYARGHLLAASLGGDGANPRNLVPLAHIATNVTTMWHGVEKKIYMHLRHFPGHSFYYKVVTDYPPNRRVVPEKLRFEGHCTMGCRLGISGSIVNAVR